MEGGRDIRTEEIRQLMEEAEDDYNKLACMIGKFDLCNDGQFPQTAREAKSLIQSKLDAAKARMSTRRQNLERAIKRPIRRTLEPAIDDFYRKTKDVLMSPDISQFLKCLLDVHIPDYNKILTQRSQSLESGEVRIMVTGETCAGKSTTMNVLMGGKYLPARHGQCTSVICELKDRKYRRASIYYDSSLTLDATELELTTDAGTAEWQRVQNCIKLGYDPALNQEGDERKYVEKIVISWPVLHMKVAPDNADENVDVQNLQECPWIRATFVDCPGFGADEATYLKLRAESCDAYIFVINNASHHGVESDRVQKMMDMLKENAELDETTLNPSSTFFICNKWDMVDSESKHSFKAEIMQRLQNIWLGITEEQLFPFCASQALTEVIHGNISEQYCDFMCHLCNVVENAVHLKLENHCLWLLQFLEKTSALINNCQRLGDFAKVQKEKLLEHAKYFKTILTELDEKCTNTMKNFEEDGLRYLDQCVKSCLKTKVTMLCEWPECDIPVRRQHENWKDYKRSLENEIKRRIITTIRQDDAIEYYKKKLDEFTEECNTKEDKLSLFGPVVEDGHKGGTILQRIIYIMRKLFSISVGPKRPDVLLSPTHLRDIPDSVHNTEQSFNENRLNYIKKMTIDHVMGIVESQVSSVARGISADMMRNFKILKENIRKRLRTLERFSEEVSSEVMKGFKSESFETITKECSSFFFNNIMNREIDCNRLKIERAIVIGQGAFGSVMKGLLTENSVSIPIAAKIIRGIDFEQDTTIFRECLLLRKLTLHAKTAKGGEYPPVVRYFGFTYSRNNDEYELIMIMELCDSDLQKQIKLGYIVHTILFPGAARETSLRTSSLPVTYALNIALQASKGLWFIHKNGIVHRDVKPSNFLMQFRGNQVIVKISDVGVSKEQNRTSTRGEEIGTFLYHSPEICSNPSAIHSFASDVYSFGLVLWEVWYGKHVFAEIPTNDLRKPVIREPPVFNDICPSDALIQLMKRCWDVIPTERPNMENVVEELAKTVAQNSR